MKKPDLSCTILGKKFSNPIWLGSGSLTEKYEGINNFLNSSVGAIVPRTTRLKYAPGRTKHPSFHLYMNRREKWMLNCEWTGNTIKYWLPYLEKIAKDGKVIMSVSGREINDCVKVCSILDKLNFPFYEINVSCAHSNEAHGYITRNKEHIEKLIKKIKENIKTPIAIKLGHSDYIVALAKAAEEAGADAIVAINTYGPVIDFNIESGKP
jgi:dihydroorotate dehydrogenase